MEKQYPDYFYKYRAVEDLSSLNTDKAIQGLFECSLVFSTRRNFNDLFDSKVIPKKPTVQKIKALKREVGKKELAEIRRLINRGKFTPEGDKLIIEMEAKLNKILDSYLFFCVSSNPISNLMWSHYADSHKGFCIEYKSCLLRAKKISYKKEVPEIDLMELINLKFKGERGSLVGKIIWSALRVKLLEWEYESEYRFQAANSMLASITFQGDNFVIVPHGQEFIESVIFGCKAERKLVDYIVKNIPYEVKFKKAVEKKSSIGIVNL